MASLLSVARRRAGQHVRIEVLRLQISALSCTPPSATATSSGHTDRERTTRQKAAADPPNHPPSQDTAHGAVTDGNALASAVSTVSATAARIAFGNIAGALFSARSVVEDVGEDARVPHARAAPTEHTADSTTAAASTATNGAAPTTHGTEMEPDAAAHGTAPAAAAAAAARPPSDTIVNSSSSSTPTGTDAAANTFTPQTAAPISRPPRSRRAIDERAQERAVPASRFGRAFQFANLGAGLAAGAVAEVGRRTFGLGSNADADAPRGSYMTPANTERLVATLCRVRGAALKLGQMVSIQDSDFLPPQLAEIFERVRESADFMPEAQLTAQLSAQLGDDWRDKFDEFDMRPFAAASIGQVHRAVLPDGVEVAVKVQYPGVADSIDSDINNLMMVLRMTGAVPKGLYIERVLDSARQELAMECDYVREAACGVRYRQLTADMQGVSCPKVYTELSGPQVLTAEMVSGVTLEHVEPMDQATRNRVAGRVLTLTLRELFEWRLMQTDPNWGNFLYDVDTDTLNLLDFGATMEYSREFIDGYIEIIHSATVIDREECLRASIALGFLSGRENSVMNDAHVSAVMALGRPFRCDGPFDFGQRDVIAEVRRLIPIMLKHREKAPPHESYSLHRKLAGAYLLCTRYKAQVDCAGAFRRLYDAYPATSSASQLPQY